MPVPVAVAIRPVRLTQVDEGFVTRTRYSRPRPRSGKVWRAASGGVSSNPVCVHTDPDGVRSTLRKRSATIGHRSAPIGGVAWLARGATVEPGRAEGGPVDVDGEAHRPYIHTVVEALEANGFKVAEVVFQPDRPRAASIVLRAQETWRTYVDRDATLCWSEADGWAVRREILTEELTVALVASPWMVTAAVCDRLGPEWDGHVDEHPEFDSRDYDGRGYDVLFEGALATYRRRH